MDTVHTEEHAESTHEKGMSDSDGESSNSPKVDPDSKVDPGESEDDSDSDSEVDPDNTSFIPKTQHSNFVLMKSCKPVLEDLTTLFIGSVRKNYPKKAWESDANKWTEYFGIKQSYRVPIERHPIKKDAINNRSAIPEILKVLSRINELPSGTKIRLVVLGTGQSAFLFDAITFLLREWKKADGQARQDKCMQFVTSGDTGDHDLNNFCSWLCISQVCETIEFYNSMHYHPFGFCSREYSAHK